jgi:hypothetical protein
MSDRLSDLQRQRALLQEHVAWLDREIARESGARPPTPPRREDAIPTSPPLPAATPVNAATQESAADTVGIPQETAGAMAADAKRGCLIAFAVGMILFFAVVLGAYFLTRGGR